MYVFLISQPMVLKILLWDAYFWILCRKYFQNSSYFLGGGTSANTYAPSNIDYVIIRLTTDRYNGSSLVNYMMQHRQFKLFGHMPKFMGFYLVSSVISEEISQA